MNKNIVIEKIKAIGLSDNESRVYIACLECGISPVSQIAFKAKINRVSAYDTLEKLMLRGMVSSTNIKRIKNFVAVDPKIFIENMQKKTSGLTSTLPFLQSLIKVKELHPTVRYFE